MMYKKEGLYVLLYILHVDGHIILYNEVVWLPNFPIISLYEILIYHILGGQSV